MLKCTACDKVIQEENGKALGHNWYKTAEKAATCTQQGHIYYCCDECYGEKVENIKALGHKNKVVKVIEQATCTKNGKEQVECTRCGNKTTRTTDKLSHAYGEWYIVAAATDSAMGRRARFCDTCGSEQVEEYYPDGTLYRGSTDKEAVKVLQSRLVECGYLNDTVDGIFGKNTEQAVKNFQTKAAVTADGIAWPETSKLLEKEWQILKGIYVEEPEKVQPEVPCCARIENEIGLVEYVYCEEHLILMDAVAALLESAVTDEQYIDALMMIRAMYQEELAMSYAEWFELSAEEEQPNVVGAQAMFNGYLNTQEMVWQKQFGKNSKITLTKVNDMLHNQWVELCGIIDLISAE